MDEYKKWTEKEESAKGKRRKDKYKKKKVQT